MLGRVRSGEQVEGVVLLSEDDFLAMLQEIENR